MMTPGLLTALKGRMGESTQNVKVKSSENESDSLSASDGNVDLKKQYIFLVFWFQSENEISTSISSSADSPYEVHRDPLAALRARKATVSGIPEQKKEGFLFNYLYLTFFLNELCIQSLLLIYPLETLLQH